MSHAHASLSACGTGKQYRSETKILITFTPGSYTHNHTLTRMHARIYTDILASAHAHIHQTETERVQLDKTSILRATMVSAQTRLHSKCLFILAFVVLFRVKYTNTPFGGNIHTLD